MDYHQLMLQWLKKLQYWPFQSSHLKQTIACSSHFFYHFSLVETLHVQENYVWTQTKLALWFQKKFSLVILYWINKNWRQTQQVKPAVISPSGPAVFRTGPSCESLSCWTDLSFADFPPLCSPPVWELDAYIGN